MITSDTIDFRVRSGWGMFEVCRRRRGNALAKQLGRPGLWKLTRGDRRNEMRRVFELPPSVLHDAGDDATRLEALARWALSTSCGKPDFSWTPPPRDEIERRLPDGALTLQIGTIALQGAMAHDIGRLAFEMPILQKIPDDLTAARTAWLRELLADGQDHWRLVRIGLTDDGRVQAEVDLSGAPHDAIDRLAPIAVGALRHAVVSLAEPAEFLINGPADCRALQIPPTQRRKA